MNTRRHLEINRLLVIRYVTEKNGAHGVSVGEDAANLVCFGSHGVRSGRTNNCPHHAREMGVETANAFCMAPALERRGDSDGLARRLA